MQRNELVYLIDQDADYRRSLPLILNSWGLKCCAFSSPANFFSCFQSSSPSCLLLDMNASPQSGIQLQKSLVERKMTTPIVFISAEVNLALSIQAMKLGAVDVLLKPLDEAMLLKAIENALEKDKKMKLRQQGLFELRTRFESLTHRERQVLPFVIGGLLNKQTAAILGIAEVTLQVHRAQIMRKTQAQSLPDLVRMSARLGIRHFSHGDPKPAALATRGYVREDLRTIA